MTPVTYEEFIDSPRFKKFVESLPASATEGDKTTMEVRLLALDRALRLWGDEEQAVRCAKVFEAYLNGETI